MRFKFTKSALSDLVAKHKGERLVVHDTDVQGLIAELREGGKLSFYLYRRIEGKPSRYRFGAFPEVTVEQVRKLAQVKLAEIASGKNPIAERRVNRESHTLTAVWEHRRRYLETHCSPRTLTEEQYAWDKRFGEFKGRQLRTIEKREVITWHAAIGKKDQKKNGPYAANRCLELLSTLFNMAADDLGYPGANPCRKIRRFPEPQRERFLQPDELEGFYKALEDEGSELMRDFFIVLLFSGARRTNVQEMRWEQVSLARKVWHIPKTKNGAAQDVPLPAPAVEVLERRKKTAGDNPWVFPSPKKAKSGHLEDAGWAWTRLKNRANLPDLRMHDLRRTMGSWLAGTGASLPIIGKTLGHKSPSATAVYARLHLDPVKQAMDTATAAILAAAKPKKKGKKAT